MEYRTEHDTMGEIKVPAEHLWGAQTQRSLENFVIGEEKMPREIIRAFAFLKRACAEANRENGTLSAEKADLVVKVCEEILAGEHAAEFPLSVWQTGSGTQTNMNVNEVIAHRAAILSGGKVTLHPNDDVNRSQSSNDTFPSAMHIAAACSVTASLFPALDRLADAFAALERENRDVLKIGRTHLQDATPLRFSQEISGWRAMLTESREMISAALPALCRLAIGGTAVGTGLGAPAGFDRAVCEKLTAAVGIPFSPDENKFHALTSKDAFVFAHGALKALAANLWKIANDIRFLASGPRAGLSEITIPANEPGSSIMPGKVNPTQCEAVTMLSLQVIANDTAIGMAASQGNFELNVFLPVSAYNFLKSVRLLADGMESFRKNCVTGIRPRREKMRENMENSLMLVTALSPVIGYDAAAKAAKHAHENGMKLKDAVLALGLLSSEEYDRAVDPEKMI